MGILCALKVISGNHRGCFGTTVEWLTSATIFIDGIVLLKAEDIRTQ